MSLERVSGTRYYFKVIDCFAVERVKVLPYILVQGRSICLDFGPWHISSCACSQMKKELSLLWCLNLETDSYACCAFKLTYLDPLLNMLHERNNSGDTFASGLLDLGRLGFVGHSRGGKLAVLHFTSEF